MGYNRWYNYEDIQMGPCIISWLGNLMLIVKKVIMLFYFIWINYQKKRSKSAKLNKENDSIKKESSFISLSGEDSNTSFSLTSETQSNQGPMDFSSSQLLASEDSNSLYESGAKRMKTEWNKHWKVFINYLIIIHLLKYNGRTDH